MNLLGIDRWVICSMKVRKFHSLSAVRYLTFCNIHVYEFPVHPYLYSLTYYMIINVDY